jgi:UDPglucose 6-dehydrogenase
MRRQPVDNRTPNSLKILKTRSKAKGIEVIVFQLVTKGAIHFHSSAVDNLTSLKQGADVIIADRRSSALDGVSGQTFTRDLSRYD